MRHEHNQESDQTTIQQSSSRQWIFWIMLAIATFFLLIEHRAHVLGWLPWLILLACLLMHVFMHRGHNGGRKHD